VFFVWDYSSAALTYFCQREIAVANGYLRRVAWFDDRVDTYLECRLVNWIKSKERKAKIDIASAIRAGIDLVPVDNIWEFAINEIARQIDRPASELMVPNRRRLRKRSLPRLTRCVPLV